MSKFWKSSITSVMFAGTLLSGLSSGLASPVSEAPLHKHVSHSSHFEGSIDLSIVNEEKLMEALIKRGEIRGKATEEQKQQQLKEYIALKGQTNSNKNTSDDPFTKQVKQAASKKQKKVKEYGENLQNGSGNKTGQVDKHIVSVKENTSPGVVKKGKLLTLMVEYADYQHNNITSDETDNYYKDYNKEHYEDMIFGDNGVKGPNGETFVSQKQYYEQQSGGTYTIEGKAYGWLKVPGTAAYYGADASTGHDNVNPGGSKQLVVDTYKAALAAGIPLGDYDLEDPHDLDGDGNFWEPDGLVDHLQIIHAGMGQEAGGGSLGDNAIWSHRSAKYVDLDGFQKGTPGFYDYTVMPEDGATGVFAHEYGHDLGLPDEYDTVYSGAGEPVSYWSIMSSGSWAGKIPGTEPTGFSPWAKQYFQATLGGEWFEPVVLGLDDISYKGTKVLLDQANTPLGKNNQAVRVNLPKKETYVNTPKTGSYEFWGGQADEIDTNMVTNVDLTGKSSATLTFDAWYQIESQWDYAFVQVSTDNGSTWKSLGNQNTSSDVVSGGYPTIINSMPGFTGNSNGWTAQSFDLSPYAGKEIKLRLRYATDWGWSELGFFADNVKVVADGQTIVEDGAETTPTKFTLNGFERFNGNKLMDHYYLLEWRNHAGVDAGLGHIKRGSSLMSFDSGLVVWYADDSYTDNWTGAHPGDGFLGVVDAHVNTDLQWQMAKGKSVPASTRYHLADAAFSLDATSGLNLVYPTQTLNYASQKGIRLFDDSNSFNNPFLPDAGRNLTSYGLKAIINGQSEDKSVGYVVIYK